MCLLLFISYAFAPELQMRAPGMPALCVTANAEDGASTVTTVPSSPSSISRSTSQSSLSDTIVEDRVEEAVRNFAKDICKMTNEHYKMQKTFVDVAECEGRAMTMIKEGKNDELFYWMWEPISDDKNVKFEAPMWWSGFRPEDKQSLLKQARHMNTYTDMDSRFNYYYKKNFDGVRTHDLTTSPMVEFYNVLNPLKDQPFVTIKNNFNEVRSSMFTASAINFLERNHKTDVIALLNKTTEEAERNLQSSFFVKNEIPTIMNCKTFKPTWRIHNVKSNDEAVKQVLSKAIDEDVDIYQFESKHFAEELQRN